MIERHRAVRNSRRAQLGGLVAAMIAAGSCGWPGKSGGCEQICDSSVNLQFDSPIGQPGNYVFVIGPRSCSVVLPALSASCVNISNFAAVGGRWLDSQAPRTLHVTVSKDGVEVMNGGARLDDYATGDVCGGPCTQAQFSMAVPPELVRPFWGPCDQSKLARTSDVPARDPGDSSHTLTNASSSEQPAIISERGYFMKSWRHTRINLKIQAQRRRERPAARKS